MHICIAYYTLITSVDSNLNNISVIRNDDACTSLSFLILYAIIVAPEVNLRIPFIFGNKFTHKPYEKIAEPPGSQYADTAV